jgi:hypothetical protein
VNSTDLYLEATTCQRTRSQQRTCHVFHTGDYMKALFPNARVLPPVNNEMQHCCIIGSELGYEPDQSYLQQLGFRRMTGWSSLRRRRDVIPRCLLSTS